MPTFRFLVLAGLAGVTGCIGEPGPETAQVTAYFRDDCGEFACGQNGARMGGVPFYGLWLNGDENEQHVRYLHYAESVPAMNLGLYQTLDVEGGRLRVWSGGTWAYGSTALRGGILLLGIGRKSFYVKIAEVRSGTASGDDIGEAFWSRVGSPDAETYQLQWAPIDGPVDANGNPRFEDVCPHDTLDSDLWQNQIDAVIFEGDKYNLQTKQITASPTTGSKAWLNIACAGSTPAKLYLLRRTTASAVLPGYLSAIDNDRQAMVRAYAAEYCGNGVNFTRSGHRLVIQDHLPIFDGQGWIPRAAPVGFSDDERDAGAVIVEAVWDANHAVCLETPRLALPDPVVPIDHDIEQRIDDACKEKRPPKCSDQSWFPNDWASHGQLLTATPLFLIASP
ncbi:MAG TPA: ADYC domain-containing protein [Kofleriaceae bacterium]|nr:ADYC domain-containing protein [Kofleriaceae bacterium]